MSLQINSAGYTTGQIAGSPRRVHMRANAIRRRAAALCLWTTMLNEQLPAN
jgi:hypothetical protein